jgi:dihydrofolate reductase
MGKVFTHMTMSLDGYIAGPDDQVGELFEWYEAGEVSVASANEDIAFRVDEASAEALGELTENAGALVSGRRLFDIARGWNDTHPIGAPVVVVTHSAPADAADQWPTTTFVDGVQEAIAKARLGPREHVHGDRANGPCEFDRKLRRTARGGVGRRTRLGASSSLAGGCRRRARRRRRTARRASVPVSPGRRARPRREARRRRRPGR